MSGQASACVESELRAAVAALRSGDADAAIDALHRSLDVGTSAVRRERPLDHTTLLQVAGVLQTPASEDCRRVCLRLLGVMTKSGVYSAELQACAPLQR